MLIFLLESAQNGRAPGRQADAEVDPRSSWLRARRPARVLFWGANEASVAFPRRGRPSRFISAAVGPLISIGE